MDTYLNIPEHLNAIFLTRLSYSIFFSYTYPIICSRTFRWIVQGWMEGLAGVAGDFEVKGGVRSSMYKENHLRWH